MQWESAPTYTNKKPSQQAATFSKETLQPLMELASTAGESVPWHEELEAIHKRKAACRPGHGTQERWIKALSSGGGSLRLCRRINDVPAGRHGVTKSQTAQGNH